MDETDKTNILLVDDRPENLLALEGLLKGPDLNIFKATSGNEALGLLLKYDFALVFLDVQMPDMDGFETAELMRGNEEISHIPIIFVTAISKEKKHVFKGYAAGAVDYIFKPLEPDILKSKVKVFLDLHKQKKALEMTNEELEKANKKIIEHQKTVIEEERLKVLLQMAGATAYELNDPLTVLLGNVRLIDKKKDDPERVTKYLSEIKTAGRRIADTIKRIQRIRYDDTKYYLRDTPIVHIDQRISILSVQDSDDDFEKIRKALMDHNEVDLSRARSIEKGIEVLERNRFDLIFLGYIFPHGNGLDFMKSMDKKGLDIPVVVITGHGDEMVASRMIQAGAYDYLTKERVNDKSLYRVIFKTLEKASLKEEMKLAQKKLGEMSTEDELTGLYNRHYMNEMLEREFSRAQRYQADMSCMILDLDYFKDINDTFGHAFGDFVLKELSVSLKNDTRGSDLCFRYGGEELMVLLPETGINGARKVAEKFREFCEKKIYDDGINSTTVTASIGVASLQDHQPAEPKDLLAYADKALYRAKADGRNRVKVYLEDDLTSPLAAKLPKDKDIKYLKEKLSVILDKTRRASMSSIELLAGRMGASKFREHNQRVSRQLELFGDKLGLSTAIIETLKRAASLHDCFKILLPQTLSTKKEPLNDEEKDNLRGHPYMLAELTELFDFFSDEKSVLLCHHENYDASGYPQGLKGDEIPLGARILALTDAFVAMTSKRPYRDMLSDEEVVWELVNNAGTQFDPMLVGPFVDVIEKNKLLAVPVEVFENAREKVRELTIVGIED